MPKVIDVLGKKFGRLTVVKLLEGSRPLKWLCKCDCGNEIMTVSVHLRSGDTTSCGCYHKEVTTTHGMYKSKEYKIWNSMIARCTNTNMKNYSDYGGRGIFVCERWMDFNNFISDMGTRPTDNHTIERKDNDKGYNPENCVWATRDIQYRNRRVYKTSISGHRGIQWHKENKNWVSRITVNKKTIHLGSFENLEDAIEARKKAELIYWPSI